MGQGHWNRYRTWQREKAESRDQGPTSTPCTSTEGARQSAQATFVMGIVGCYDLALYCDHPDAEKWVCTSWPGEFQGRNFSEARREAKRAGWTIRRSDHVDELGSGEVRCPLHKKTQTKRSVRPGGVAHGGAGGEGRG